mgnify:CR=1 FL=1
MERRKVLQSAVAALILPWYGFRTWASTEAAGLSQPERDSEISIILPQKSNTLPTDESLDSYQYRLYRAVLSVIHNHYSGKPMPIWGKAPEEVDLETRIKNITYWVLRSVQKHSATYFIDPAWIMAQIMEESFFYEFAVSWSFASGICQFTMPTAEKFGMVTPRTSRISEERLKHPERAQALDRLKALRKRKNKVRSKNKELFSNQSKLFKESLRHHIRGTTLTRAESWLNALQEMDSIEESMQSNRKKYMNFLRSNYEGKDIFDHNDLDFLQQLDERVVYKKPIEAMLKIMTRYMRGRNGNILVATAGYNSGLSRTYYPYAVYEPYGKIPNYEETVSYVSKIVVNHYEILQRLTE